MQHCVRSMFQNEDMSCKESTEKLLPYGPRPPRHRIWPLMHAGRKRDFAAPRGAAFPPGYSTWRNYAFPAKFRDVSPLFSVFEHHIPVKLAGGRFIYAGSSGDGFSFIAFCHRHRGYY